MKDIGLVDKLSKERYELSNMLEEELQKEIYRAIKKPKSKNPVVKIHPDLHDLGVRLSIGYPEEFGATFDILYTKEGLEFSLASKRINEEAPRTKEIMIIISEVIESENQLLEGIRGLMETIGKELKGNMEDYYLIDEETKQKYFESDLFKERKKARERK